MPLQQKKAAGTKSERLLFSLSFAEILPSAKD